MICLPCGPGRLVTPSGPHQGTLKLKIKQVVELGHRHGSPIYAMWKLGGFSMRSEQAVVNDTEAIWMHDSPGVDPYQRLTVNISELDGDQKLDVELWTSYLALWDQIIDKASISLLPVVWHPNLHVDRWFDLPTSGRVLVEVVFHPTHHPSRLPPSAAPTSHAPSSPSQRAQIALPPTPASSSSALSSWLSLSSLSILAPPLELVEEAAAPGLPLESFSAQSVAASASASMQGADQCSDLSDSASVVLFEEDAGMLPTDIQKDADAEDLHCIEEAERGEEEDSDGGGGRIEYGEDSEDEVDDSVVEELKEGEYCKEEVVTAGAAFSDGSSIASDESSASSSVSNVLKLSAGGEVALCLDSTLLNRPRASTEPALAPAWVSPDRNTVQPSSPSTQPATVLVTPRKSGGSDEVDTTVTPNNTPAHTTTASSVVSWFYSSSPAPAPAPATVPAPGSVAEIASTKKVTSTPRNAPAPHSLDMLDMGHIYSHTTPTVTIDARPADLVPTDDGRVFVPPPCETFCGTMLIHLSDIYISHAAYADMDVYISISVPDMPAAGKAYRYVSPTVAAHSHTVHHVHDKAVTTYCYKVDLQYAMPCAHHRSKVLVRLIDASSDVCVATISLFPYLVLQGEQDREIWHTAEPAQFGLRNNQCEDVGFVYLRACFKENAHLYHVSQPQAVRVAGDEELSLEQLNAHFQRMYAIVNLLTAAYNDYMAVMSWQDPIHTSACFIVYLTICVFTPADHQLSILFVYPIYLMSKAYVLRRSAWYKTSFCGAEADAQAEPASYAPYGRLAVAVLGYRHRQNNMLRHPVVKATYLMPSSSLPGAPSPDSQAATAAAPVPTAASATSAPSSARSQDATGKSSPHYPPPHQKMDHHVSVEEARQPSSEDERLVGFLYGTSTVAAGRGLFSSRFLSPTTPAADHALHNVLSPLPLPAPVLEYVARLRESPDPGAAYLFPDQAHAHLLYPILSPPLSLHPAVRRDWETLHAQVEALYEDVHLHHKGLFEDADEVRVSSFCRNLRMHRQMKRFVPWEAHPGVIRLSLAHDPAHSLMPDMEYIHLPIAYVCHPAHFQPAPHPDEPGAGRYEVVQWLVCKDSAAEAAATRHPVTLHPPDELYGESSYIYHDDRKYAFQHHSTELLVRVVFEPPSIAITYAPSAAQIQQSQTLQAALKPRSVDSKSSYIYTLYKMKDYIAYVQNMLAYVCDLCEGYKNVFLWTLPHKTRPVYLVLLATYALTVLVPTKMLLVALGLYQFLYVLLPISEGDEYVVMWNNHVQSVPKDVDLREIYKADIDAHMARTQEVTRERTRQELLSMTLPLPWSGEAHLKCNNQSWQPVFLCVQGARLVWFEVKETATTGACAGQMLLAGLANIVQVSPVDIREKGEESKMMSIFGQDNSGRPLKVTALCASPEARQALVRSVQLVLDHPTRR